MVGTGLPLHPCIDLRPVEQVLGGGEPWPDPADALDTDSWRSGAYCVLAEYRRSVWPFQNNSGFFSILALLISAGAVYAYVTRLPNQQVSVQISMGLILGGAIGNVIDRVRLGYVVDFIQVGWWPIFNIADSSITIGATLLGLFLLFAPDEPPQTVQAGPVDDALLDDLLRKDAGTLEQNRQNPGS
ncbi:MAG: signal peptidase II [Blastochloris sp.]|nr:signal peptidase II [Blastochloris sp.]